jgi:hypothetical protein
MQPTNDVSATAPACRLCGGETAVMFTAPLSRGLTGHYRECRRCHFLSSDHVDDPAVRARVYESANPADDPGAAYRQLCIALRLTQLVRARLFEFGPRFQMLDFGTAAGFLPGSLAQRFAWQTLGFDAYARPFYDPARVTSSWQEVTKSGPFDLVVATEVLEHFTDPMSEIERIATVMRPERSFLYATTTLYDPKTCGGDWKYLAPHTAQHCAFYSRGALARVASTIGAELLQLSEPQANEWLFVRGRGAVQVRARAAAWVIRKLMRHRRIPGFE